MVNKLTSLKNFSLTRTEWGTVIGRFKNIDFSIFYYQYPLLKKTKKFKGINIASLEDIAAMKIAAIGDRGTKRDFIDLYMICKSIPLEDSLFLYEKKYGVLASTLDHILKSLTYFIDAEEDPMPKMFSDVKWKTVRQYFMQETPRVSKRLVY